MISPPRKSNEIYAFDYIGNENVMRKLHKEELMASEFGARVELQEKEEEERVNCELSNSSRTVQNHKASFYGSAFPMHSSGGTLQVRPLN